MQYQISGKDSTLTVKFEGILSAVDLIFMNQDQRYRHALEDHRNLFLDFSQVTSSKLTAEDRIGLALLGKRDAEKVTNINLVILLGLGEQESVGMFLKHMFAGSTWKVTVAQSREEAMSLLKA